MWFSKQSIRRQRNKHFSCQRLLAEGWRGMGELEPDQAAGFKRYNSMLSKIKNNDQDQEIRAHDDRRRRGQQGQQAESD